MQKVFNGNNIDLLKNYPDNHFDSIVTDPPYGLGKEPNAVELMKDWIEKGYHEILGSGFMGKEWDAFVPQPIFWKEVFRVTKPGGHILAFYGTRTYDWGVMAMRFAGFEVRDCIQWLYGSGFPKSHNISKAIDKIEGNEREVVGETKAVKTAIWNKHENRTEIEVTKGQTIWEGWGTALKPAHEDIVLARKPLEKGLSIAENILKWGVGGINIDASRIGLSSKDNKDNGRVINRNIRESEDGWGMQDNKADRVEVLSNQGRFPANIILTHHEDCECKGTKKVKAIKGGNSGTIGNEVYGKFNGKKNNDGCGFGDENGQEEVENWDCHEDCPIRILDEQSGVSKSSNAKRTRNTLGSFGMPNDKTREYSDKGGASRFFYCAKASKSERNKGLDVFETKQTTGGGGTYNEDAGAKYGSIKAEGKNFHPTVKPIKLMQYLVKMITPPNGIVLDPFCGSGTTGVACKIDGFKFVGLEQDPEYAKIAEARINNYIDKEQSNTKEKDQLTLF